MNKRLIGRIVRSLSGFYDVQTDRGLIVCRARGILRKEGSTPLTGDLAEITVERERGMVERILPRKNSFIRPAVANVDALVVFAANANPVTEPFLIDRVAAIAGDLFQKNMSENHSLYDDLPRCRKELQASTRRALLFLLLQEPCQIQPRMDHHPFLLQEKHFLRWKR